MRTKKPWIEFERKGSPAKFRLFCLPYAGGSALSFKPFSTHLLSSIEICPIEIPGRGVRINENPFTRLDLLVPEIAAGIKDFTELPFAFFGHSMESLAFI